MHAFNSCRRFQAFFCTTEIIEKIAALQSPWEPAKFDTVLTSPTQSYMVTDFNIQKIAVSIHYIPFKLHWRCVT